MSISNTFSLILTCGGLKLNDIILCSSTANTIINFDRHFDELRLEKIMDFLDYSCNLFDGPIIDINKAVNVLRMFKDQYALIDDKLWDTLHIWLPQHKRCGIVLSLCLNDNVNCILDNEVSIVNSSMQK